MGTRPQTGKARAILAGLCLLVMVGGLLSIPFVSTAIAIGIVVGAGVLYLLIAALVPKANREGDKQ